MRTHDWFVLKVEPCWAVLSRAEQGCAPPLHVDGGRRQGARPICDVVPEVPQQTGWKNRNPWSGAGEVAVVGVCCSCMCVCVGRRGTEGLGQPCLLLGFTWDNESTWQICAKGGLKVILSQEDWKHYKKVAHNETYTVYIFFKYCVFLSGIHWFLLTREQKNIMLTHTQT